MPFQVNNPAVHWLVGNQVEGTKALLRQTDTSFLMEILRQSLRDGGALHAMARMAQRVCTEAHATVMGTPIASPISAGGQSIWTWYDNAGTDEYCINVRILASLVIMRDGDLVNSLAFGDFCRAFADLIGEVNAGQNQTLADISTFMRALQNQEAFSKTTNRVRVKRRDILDQMPGVGGTQWYIPPDDVLGTIDRALGYYEMGDISGTTTDSVGAIAVLSAIQGNDIGSLNAIKASVASLVNTGLAFAVFASMVIQQHHSLPECMMALNLMPRDLGVDEPGQQAQGLINQVYSPYLTNANFVGLNALNDLYAKWQQGRFAALGGGARGAQDGRMLLVMQDIFQMPAYASDRNEVAMIVPFTYDPALATNDGSLSGLPFYNQIVGLLNTANPGPAITLEKVSKAVADSLFGHGAFNPVTVPIQPGDSIQARVKKGMALPAGVVDAALNYNELIAPFVPVSQYSKIQSANFHNL